MLATVKTTVSDNIIIPKGATVYVSSRNNVREK